MDCVIEVGILFLSNHDLMISVIWTKKNLKEKEDGTGRGNRLIEAT